MNGQKYLGALVIILLITAFSIVFNYLSYIDEYISACLFQDCDLFRHNGGNSQYYLV